MMIVDSHAHAFPPLGGASGYRTAREHLRYLQREMFVHHQPVRRSDDQIDTTEETLHDGVTYTLDGMLDVQLRSAGFGRLAWHSGGVEYYKQYLPPTLVDLAAPPELMLAQMDYAGVTHAVLQTGHIYGRINRYLSEVCRRHPDRFWGLAQINEWRMDRADQRRALCRAIEDLGLHGLYFETVALGLHGRGEAVNDPSFDVFWDQVRDLGIPVFWHITSAEPTPSAYLTQLRGFARWIKRYPEVPCLFTHGVSPGAFENSEHDVYPEEVWEMLRAPNLMVEILFPIREGRRWDYPYREAWPIVRRLYERLGPEKLVWGSDMPNVERHCTYRQSLEYLRSYCDFIPTAEMSLICGGNVVRLMRRG